MSFGTGMALGMCSGMLLSDMFDDAEPIEFHCKNCGHSYLKHVNGTCDKGLMKKCDCTSFMINQDEVDQANKEIEELRSILFKHYNEALDIQGISNHVR